MNYVILYFTRFGGEVQIKYKVARFALMQF